jgi:hypothetical protein
MVSPYVNKDSVEWQKITKELVDKHPLLCDEIVRIVLESWDEIYRSKIGRRPYYIGKDIFPKPQIMGFFLHELIPLAFETQYPGQWRRERSAKDKDIIYIPDDFFSIEMKTSSNPRSIFGNRSYAQASNAEKKSKSGYYLAINFEKFGEKCPRPRILMIRFGWLDHEDWVGQKSATGQQSRLKREVENGKLFLLYAIE